MIFNSFVFLLIFIPIVVAGYWIHAPRQRARLGWWVVASLVFYAYADWRHTLLMIAVALLGYATSSRIAQSETTRVRRFWLGLSISVFMLPLGFFKYFDFAASSTQSFLNLFGIEVEFGLLQLALPLGISFYTFKALSYCLDLHNRRLDTAATLLPFLAYLTLFQELIAGPISRYRNLQTQLAALPEILDQDHITTAAYLIVFGLAKKVLIADRIAAFVDPLLGKHAELGFLSAWTGVLGYALQLYFDFSGYSDMAVGLGHLFGLKLPRNFQNPYRAENIAAFWNRWHITLSHWFRDYVFFPLSRGWLKRARSRPDLVRTGSHLLTMSLVGLWHGASWTFVLWGLYHGMLLAVYTWFRPRNRLSARPWINIAITFVLVLVGWAIFYSESTAQLGDLLTAMAGLNGLESLSTLNTLIGLRFSLLITLGLGIVFLVPASWEVPHSPRRRAGIALGILLSITIIAMGETITFLYRQF